MRNPVEIKNDLKEEAERISQKYEGAPVVIVIAGSKGAGVPRCITVHSQLVPDREDRMRDLLGILQAAIQIESFNHLWDLLLQKGVLKLQEESD